MDDLLRNLADESAIRDLAVRYCWALDSLDRTAFEQLFTTDPTASLGGGLQEGLDAIWERIHRTLAPLSLSQHIVGSHLVQLSDDTASHRCYVHAQHVRPGLPDGDQFVVAGSYLDDCVRTPDGWRIRHRALKVLWTSGNPAVIAP